MINMAALTPDGDYFCALVVDTKNEFMVFSTKDGKSWACMMTSSNGNSFRVTDHLCGEFTGHRWIPSTKASDAELFSLICARTNGWVYNGETGDLRRHHAHYDVTVMIKFPELCFNI